MRIETGKRYRDREGKEWIIRAARSGEKDYETHPFREIEDTGRSWRVDGSWSSVVDVSDMKDLIRCVDEPAQTPNGVKDDAGKLPWALLPFDALRGIVQVLDFGQRKYAPRNWEKGMDWSRCFDACLRHLTSWWQGEAQDPETGLSHLTHAGCCLLFLIAYEIRGVGKDDRPTHNSP